MVPFYGSLCGGSGPKLGSCDACRNIAYSQLTLALNDIGTSFSLVAQRYLGHVSHLHLFYRVLKYPKWVYKTIHPNLFNPECRKRIVLKMYEYIKYFIVLVFVMKFV
jgi:hypothetical protein